MSASHLGIHRRVPTNENNQPPAIFVLFGATGKRLAPAFMHFGYQEAFNKPTPDAYETLLQM